MEKLKAKEKIVYDYIVQSVRENGFAPSVRDICRELDYKSTSTVHMYLNRLDRLGYIEKTDGKSRALRVLIDDVPTAVAVPVLGCSVTEDGVIFSEQNYEGYVGYIGEASADLLFALRMKGDSMTDAGIRNGDVILAEKTCYAESGELVVVILENEAVVRRFFREERQYVLRPEHSGMSPITVDEAMIIGRVVEIRHSCT